MDKMTVIQLSKKRDRDIKIISKHSHKRAFIIFINTNTPGEGRGSSRYTINVTFTNIYEECLLNKFVDNKTSYLILFNKIRKSL